MGALSFAIGWTLVALPADAKSERNGIKHVVLIILDGVRPDTLQEATTPNMDELVAGGSYTWNAWAAWPPITLANIPSIFSGALPAVHGIERWTDRMQAESIVEVLERAGLKCAVVGQGAMLGGFAATFHSDFDGRDDYLEHFTRQAIQYLEEHRPFFVSVYNPIPDKTAHSLGHQNPKYRESIEEADRYIGRLMDALKRLGIFEHTLIAITTDHGMTGRSHSLGHATDMRIFSIWHGPGIKRGFEMPNTIEVPAMPAGRLTATAHRVPLEQWKPEELSWETQPALGEPLQQHVITDRDWYTWTVSDAIRQDFTNHKAAAFALRTQEEAEGFSALFFNTTSWRSQAQHPYLRIEYRNRGEDETRFLRVPPSAEYQVRALPGQSVSTNEDSFVLGRSRNAASRAYFHFDLNQLAEGAEIVNALLHTYVWRVVPVGYPATTVAHHTTDTAPTIAALLKLDPPRHSPGKPMRVIFAEPAGAKK